MQAAIAEIRAEGRKVAAIHAIADAALVTVLVLLVSAVLGLGVQVSLPPALRGAISAIGGPSLPGRVGGIRVLAGVVGLVVGIGQYWRLSRRPIVEQFEAANPEVSDRLRTARDAVDAGDGSVMAHRLYEDVLDRLNETSSWRLVSARRLSAQIALVFVIGLASVGVIAAGIGLDLGEQSPTERTEPPDYEGLQDADRVLGEPENVSAGDESLDARIGTSGEGSTSGNASVPRLGTGGDDATGRIDAQQADYASSEAVENAALIREYNLRIREEATE